ncbi:hypothetical protein ABKN59_002872 [Abortiporus biennis]
MCDGSQVTPYDDGVFGSIKVDSPSHDEDASLSNVFFLGARSTLRSHVIIENSTAFQECTVSYANILFVLYLFRHIVHFNIRHAHTGSNVDTGNSRKTYQAERIWNKVDECDVYDIAGFPVDTTTNFRIFGLHSTTSNPRTIIPVPSMPKTSDFENRRNLLLIPYVSICQKNIYGDTCKPQAIGFRKIFLKYRSDTHSIEQVQDMAVPFRYAAELHVRDLPHAVIRCIWDF